jgi:hypothetical protein
MTGEVAHSARSVDSLDRVDPKLDELARMQNARLDDALTKVGPGGILRGRLLGRVRSVGQSTTAIMRPPLSRPPPSCGRRSVDHHRQAAAVAVA